MAWPKGRPRKRTVVAIDPASPNGDCSAKVTASIQDGIITIEEVEFIKPEEPLVPRGWIKGQLLNVRNGGEAYIITLFPDEFDPRYPERSMRFTNPGECQNFISKWYTQEHHDPRAR